MGEFAAAAESVVMAAEAVPDTPTVDAPAQDVSPASESPEPTTADPAPSAPADGTSESPSESRRAPNGRFQKTEPQYIPYKRFNEVTKQNQTYKAENERLKTLEQNFGWLKPDHAPVMRSFYERFQTDPDQALIVETIERLERSPQARARYKEALSKYIAEQQAAKDEAQADPEPQPDYETEDGDPVYSAKRQAEWMAWHKRQMKADFDKELEPLKARAQKAQQVEVYAELEKRADENAKSVVTPFLANPLFIQNKTAIQGKYRQYIQQAKAQGREPDGEMALYRAFNDVLQSVASQAQTAHGRSVAASLQAKPGASALNPARPVAAAAAPRPSSFGEAAAKILGVR